MSTSFSEQQPDKGQETSRTPGDIMEQVLTSMQKDIKYIIDSEFESLDRCKEDERVFNLCCERYRCFRRMQQQLLTLTFAVGAKCDAILGDTLIPASYIHGYRKLPNEIFIRIATLLSSEDVLRLSHVNKHLREVLCSTPSLWTTVDTIESFDYLRMKLDRSKHYPLDAVLNFSEYMASDGKCGTAAFELLFAQQKRWQSLSFDASARVSNFDFRTIPKQHLQSIKTLEIPGFEEHVLEDDVVDYVLSSCEGFHRAWTIPASKSLSALTTLIMGEDIPSSQTPSDVYFPYLTDLRFIFKNPELADDSRLHAFITVHDALKSLSISVDSVAGLHRTFRYQSSLPTIMLPHLKKLRCCIALPETRCRGDKSHCSRSDSSFCNLIRGISAAAAEEIEFEWAQGLDLVQGKIPPLPAVGYLFRHEEMQHLKSFQILVQNLDTGWIRSWRPFVFELHKLFPSVTEVIWQLPRQKSKSTPSIQDQFPTGSGESASLELPGMKEAVTQQLVDRAVTILGLRDPEEEEEVADTLAQIEIYCGLEGVNHKVLSLCS